MSDDLLSRIEQARRAAVVVDADERAANRERFPLVTELVTELRAQGFKGTKLVFARNDAGETYGAPLPADGWVSIESIDRWEAWNTEARARALNPRRRSGT
jgi:hypothetical protein